MEKEGHWDEQLLKENVLCHPSALWIISLSQEKSVVWSSSTCSFHALCSSSRAEWDREGGRQCHKPKALHL